MLCSHTPFLSPSPISLLPSPLIHTSLTVLPNPLSPFNCSSLPPYSSLLLPTTTTTSHPSSLLLYYSSIHLCPLPTLPYLPPVYLSTSLRVCFPS
ncbi:hypothetical protein Pcinc_040231 [Petrolisthes cinctipes]|uniref:Uncharacterized protein n=1 Tax=Petrolisthes cinctipes TaxID=88211 RepID=A0AAE1EIT2_PETCI|nr:hypothetical protein Pcinc_040231 [Petrolisthes cinctipes]